MTIQTKTFTKSAFLAAPPGTLAKLVISSASKYARNPNDVLLLIDKGLNALDILAERVRQHPTEDLESLYLQLQEELQRARGFNNLAATSKDHAEETRMHACNMNLVVGNLLLFRSWTKMKTETIMGK